MKKRKNRRFGGVTIADEGDQNSRDRKQMNVASGAIVNTRKDGS